MAPRNFRSIFALLLALAATLTFSAEAGAAPWVYWTNLGGDTVSRADAAGGGGAAIVSGGTVSGPRGVAIDRATGKIYWANSNNGTIEVANADGSGAQLLDTTGTTPVAPSGIAVDRIGGRVYWGNGGDNTIGYANLDGSGGGGLFNTATGPTSGSIQGVSVDRPNNRLYWSTDAGNEISFASLDGTGASGSLDTTGAPTVYTNGANVEGLLGRVFWANYGDDTIGYAATDGSGGGTLDTTGAPVSSPGGVGIDYVHNRIYWSNYGGSSIGFANADGTGSGGTLDTTGSSINGPWSQPAVSGAGVGSFSPSTASFVQAGSKQVSLQNTGDWLLTLGASSISSAQASLFSQTNNCPAVLAPGASCSYTVSFAGGGAAAASLAVATDAGTATLPLGTTGVALTKVGGTPRCSSVAKSSKIKLGFTLNVAAKVTVSLQKRTSNQLTPRRCPQAKHSPHKPSSKAGKKYSKTTSGVAGANSMTLPRLVGIKGDLAPGHYRLLVQATAADGTKSIQQGGWIWVLRP
ncbi:MAG: hypothetical protein ACRDKI_03515 [Solirubrobacterales bacterium]